MTAVALTTSPKPLRRYTGPKRPYLERLVINVSHDCNLRCSYCYADTGAYGSERMTLSKGVGLRVVDDFLSRFRQIGKIQFFGGEPFLNYRGIESICEHAARVSEREGVPAPGFTLITNGTILNEDILQLIGKYRIGVTVSLDGNRSINDTQRIYANGKGSFDKVVKNICRMKERTGQPSQIEGTYTARHVLDGFSLVEFMQFVAHELDVHFIHMPWIVGRAYNGTGIEPTDKNVEFVIAEYSDAVTASLKSLLTQDLQETILISVIESSLTRALSGGRGGTRKHICPAGSGTLSVGADGKIFPCFMFTNVSQFEFGRVGNWHEEEFDRKRAAFVDQLAIPSNENARGYETGAACAGQNFDINGRIDAVSAANRHIQNEVDVHLQKEIRGLEANSEHWEWLKIKLMLTQLAMGEASANSGC